MIYTYFIGSLIVLALWLALFLHRKDVRKEMLLVSTFVAFAGLILEVLIWTKDWWKPETITGTVIGVEDFIYGFAVGGIAAVIYEELFKKKVYSRKKTKHNIKDLVILIILSFVVGTFSFFILGLHSFTSTILALAIPTIILLTRRPDLIIDSVATGGILTVVGLFGFLVLNFISPGFVYKWYFLDTLSGILVMGYPIEDLVWYFIVGMFLGPIYEFWQNARLVKER